MCPPSQSPRTQAIHAGETRPKPFGALTTPVVQTSTFTFENTAEILAYMRSKQAEESALRDEYGRYSNPTQTTAEKKLAVLEGAEGGVMFASGMAAITTTLLTRLSSGDHVIMVSDAYHRTREFALMFLARWGIETSLVAVDRPEEVQAAIRPETRVIFAETPTNPYLRVADIAKLVEIASQGHITTIVDSTFATPLNLRPLEFGVDLVIHSASKYLGGHNDLLAGVVLGSEIDLAPIRHARGVMGAVSNPNDAYLLLRGLKTLPLRVRQHNENGLKLAQYLEDHPGIERVYYPGLASHPDHETARRQMDGFGGVVSFEVQGGFEETGRFIDRLQIPYIGPTLGGVESIVQQPAALFSLLKSERMAAGLKDNLVRYAVGVEAAEDLIADLGQALASI
jgi:cystathionine gamma-synthase